MALYYGPFTENLANELVLNASHILHGQLPRDAKLGTWYFGKVGDWYPCIVRTCVVIQGGEQSKPFLAGVSSTNFGSPNLSGKTEPRFQYQLRPDDQRIEWLIVRHPNGVLQTLWLEPQAQDALDIPPGLAREWAFEQD